MKILAILVSISSSSIMDLTRLHFRVMIFYDFKGGVKPKESIKRLLGMNYREEIPKSLWDSCLEKWFGRMKKCIECKCDLF